MRPMYQPSFYHQTPTNLNWDQEFSRADAKGKGKAIDADFDAAFARAAASVTETSRVVELEHENETLEAAFKRVRIEDAPEDPEKYMSDFQK